MPSTSLEMHQNRFRSGLCPGPHWGSVQHSLRPLAGGDGCLPRPPQEPHPSSALRASAIQAMLCRPPTPPKINPSYGLVVQSVCSRRASWLQLVQRKSADARTTRTLVVIKLDRSTSSRYWARAFSPVTSGFKKPFFWEKVNGCRVILWLLILYNTLVSENELFA